MSLETDAVIAFVHHFVPGAPVSAVLGTYISSANPCSPHGLHSYHCAEGTNGKGLAVDWGGDEATLLAVWHALAPEAPHLAELFHNNPPEVTKVVKNGMWADGLTTLGATVWAAHTNHVHVAVPRGVYLTPPQAPKVKPMYDPALVLEPIVAELSCPTGGVWLAAASGAIYAFGGAPYLGSPKDKSYFVGRSAAQLRLVNGQYAVIATSGETYGPGF